MLVWMLWEVIWTCFFTKFVCSQNSCVISHMSSFSTKIWQADRSSSQESNKIEFASNILLQLKIFTVEWLKVNTCRMSDLSLKTAIFMPFFPLYMYREREREKGMDISFLMPLESLRFDFQSSSSVQNIDRRSNLPIISNLLCFESYI